MKTEECKLIREGIAVCLEDLKNPKNVDEQLFKLILTTLAILVMDATLRDRNNGPQ